MQVKCDRKLLIAIGRSRKASQWQNKEMLWSEFLDKLATTTRTRETVAEYAAMPKGERDTIKDVGCFVSGYLKTADATTPAWSTAVCCVWTRITPIPVSWTIWT